MVKKRVSVGLLILFSSAYQTTHAMMRMAAVSSKKMPHIIVRTSLARALHVPVRYQTSRSLIAGLPKPPKPSSRLVYISTEASKLQESIDFLASRISEAKRFNLSNPMIENWQKQLNLYKETLQKLKKTS